MGMMPSHGLRFPGLSAAGQSGASLATGLATATAAAALDNRAAASVTESRWAGGADPTGAVSAVAAFKAALAGSNRVFVPPGRYKFDGPILWQWANRELFGVAGQSVLFHTNPSSSDIVLDCFFVLGDCHPVGYDARNSSQYRFPRYPVSGALAFLTRTIPLTNQADADAIAVGQIVWVRDAATFAGSVQEFARGGASDGNYYAQPDSAHLVRVVKKSGSTLTLDRPIFDAITTAIVSPISGTDPYLSGLAWFGGTVSWGIADSPHIHHLVFEDGFSPWTRNAVYEGHFHDLVMRRMAYPLPNNAMTKTLIERVVADYSWFCIEAKQSSEKLTVKDCQFNYLPWTVVAGFDNNSSPVNPVGFGERSSQVVIEGCEFNVGAEWTGNARFVDMIDAKECMIRSTHIHLAGGSTSEWLSLRGHSDTGARWNSGHHLFDAVSVDFGIQKQAEMFISGTTQDIIAECSWINYKSYGTAPSTNRVVSTATSHMLMTLTGSVGAGRDFLPGSASIGFAVDGLSFAGDGAGKDVRWYTGSVGSRLACKQGASSSACLVATGGTAPLIGISAVFTTGSKVTVFGPGSRIYATSGAAFAIGDLLTANGTGQLITATSGDYVAARALAAAAGAAASTLVLVLPPGTKAP